MQRKQGLTEQQRPTEAAKSAKLNCSGPAAAATHPVVALRLRVAAAFFADSDHAAAGREAAALPPSFPPLRDGAVFSGLPRPLPLFLPPPVSLFTVAQARRSASSSGTPRC